MRILVSAYSADPTRGSEHAVGWEWSRAAARNHDVWLLTRRKYAPQLEEALRHERGLRINPVYFDMPTLSPALERLGLQRTHYLLWQSLVRRTVVELHRRHGFDVLHHLTFASDWAMIALTAIPDVPLIWGPVGGSTNTPLSLLRYLGPRGIVFEAGRMAPSALARYVWGDRIARRASLVVANNKDTRRRYSYHPNIIVEPNPPIPPSPPIDDDHGAEEKTLGKRRAICVGRLVPLKGCALALEALTVPSVKEWSLDFYGDGPDWARLERRVDELRLRDRVRFLGKRPRQEVLRAYRSADALLFPSFHDSSPLTVAEALTSGCPVVCLDHGGPAALVEGSGFGFCVPIRGNTAAALADALTRISGRHPPSDRWSRERLPALLDSWYKSVVE